MSDLNALTHAGYYVQALRDGHGDAQRCRDGIRRVADALGVESADALYARLLAQLTPEIEIALAKRPKRRPGKPPRPDWLPEFVAGLVAKAIESKQRASESRDEARREGSGWVGVGPPQRVRPAAHRQQGTSSGVNERYAIVLQWHPFLFDAYGVHTAASVRELDRAHRRPAGRAKRRRNRFAGKK